MAGCVSLAWKAPKSRARVLGSPPACVRFAVQAQGPKSWIIRFRERGVERFRTLGKAPELGMRDAQRKVVELLRNLALDGLPQDIAQTNCGITFDQFGDEFLNPLQGTWKPSTRRRNAHALRREILPTFGQLSVAHVVGATIYPWRDGMAAKASALNRALPVLSAIFAHAKVLGYRRVGTNPWRGISRFLPPSGLSFAGEPGPLTFANMICDTARLDSHPR